MGLKPGVHLAEDEQKDQIFEIVEKIRAATHSERADDIELHLSFCMTAAAIYIGTQFGIAVAGGLQTNDLAAKKKVKRMIARNFDAGVDVGLRAASRIAKEDGSMQ